MACMQAREAWRKYGICACSAACIEIKMRGLSPAQPWPATFPWLIQMQDANILDL